MHWKPLPVEARAGTSIAVAGDWHGNEHAVATVLNSIARERPDIRVVHQVGDYGLWPGSSGHRFNKLMQRLTNRHRLTVVVTPGNHEWYDRLERQWAANPFAPIPALGWTGTWFLPRGYRWTHAGRRLLSLGGAASPDRQSRTPGTEWWRQERVGDGDMVRTIIGGKADVMFSHESPAPGTPRVERAARLGSTRDEQDERWAFESRRRVTLAYEAVAPNVLFHGHYHVADSAKRSGGRSIESMAAEAQPGSVAYLDLTTLATQR